MIIQRKSPGPGDTGGSRKLDLPSAQKQKINNKSSGTTQVIRDQYFVVYSVGEYRVARRDEPNFDSLKRIAGPFRSKGRAIAERQWRERCDSLPHVGGSNA